jgi:transposase
MEEHSIVFVGLDVSKDRHAVAIAEGGRDGELRYLGEIGSDDASIRRLVKRLARPEVELRFCYEAGPTGYGLKRMIEALGHSCAVPLSPASIAKASSNTPALLNRSNRFHTLFHLPNRSGSARQVRL